MIPTSYDKPPIVEAVVELRVSGGTDWKEAEGNLLAAFTTAFPGPRQELSSVQVQARWRGESMETASRKDFLKWLLPDATGRQFIGLGSGVFSFHVLAPYPGWLAFRQATEQAFVRYCEVVKPETLVQVGVRYIDQIVLPPEGRLGDYFQAIPPRLPSQPTGVIAFQITTESHDAETNTTSLLTLASAPQSAEDRRVVLYDLNLTREPKSPVAPDAWPESADLLHKLQRDVFEESITASTRELFK